jgi:hypothetical protein
MPTERCACFSAATRLHHARLDRHPLGQSACPETGGRRAAATATVGA